MYSIATYIAKLPEYKNSQRKVASVRVRAVS